MKAKSTLVDMTTPFFKPNGTVQYSTRMYAYNWVHLSGWDLVRGDHTKPNAHSYRVIRGSGSGKLDRWYYSTYEGYARVGSAVPYGYPDKLPPASVYNGALEKLYGKIRGDLDLSIDAFQARQTARQFKAGDLVANFARDLKKNPGWNPLLRKSVAIGKLLGSARLAWVYGWKPLVSDYYGVLDESLRDYINHFQTFKASSGYSETVVVPGRVINEDLNLAPFNLLYKYQVTISVKLDTSAIAGLSHWTSLNPASIAWELLPFSFVIDWFIDVGTTLRSVESALLYNKAFKDGYVSQITTASGVSRGGKGTKDGYTFKVTGSFAWNYVRFQRSVLTAMPLPKLHIPRPRLGVDRLLNAAGLLVGFLGNKRH